MRTMNEKRAAAGHQALAAHTFTKRQSGKRGGTPKQDRPIMDRLDEVADAISDILHYAQSAGLIDGAEQVEDLAGRAVRNYRAESTEHEG